LIQSLFPVIGIGLLLVAIDGVACFQSNLHFKSHRKTNHYPTGGSTVADHSDGRLFALPRVIVFDLDNTLWTPELYRLRHLERSGQTPVAGEDVKLFDGAKEILEDVLPNLGCDDDDDDEPRPILAVASRTDRIDWAEDLLDQFGLTKRFDAIAIFPGKKTNHLSKIRRLTGVPFEETIFFDDSRDGRFGNCEPVAAMGVFCVHCPDGLSSRGIFERALDLYQNEWDKTPNTIVEANGEMAVNSPRPPLSSKKYEGFIKLLRREKHFGFIKFRAEHGRRETRDVFFHFSKLMTEPSGIEEGDKVSFQMRKDYRARGKDLAFNIDRVRTEDDDDDDESSSRKQLFRCVSMKNPFAALVANGRKTLETRNGTMLTKYAEGTQVLLHVGRRTYPDSGKHLGILKASHPELTDGELRTLTSLPEGFAKGHIVAILELGRTYETTLDDRSDPKFERRALAHGPDSGRIVTEIRRAAYLKQPVPQTGEPGVFRVRIDPEVIPDGWSVPSSSSSSLSLDLRAFQTAE